MSNQSDRLNSALSGRYTAEKEISARSDVYSLGSVLFEKLADRYVPA